MLKIIILLNLMLNAAPQDAKFIPKIHTPAVAAPTSAFRSYREWKSEQLAYWQSRGQAEMAKDLTVADYFAGYLTKQRDQAQAIKEVSGRLSPDEVAELMTIYANSVFGSHSPMAPKQGETLIKEATRQP